MDGILSAITSSAGDDFEPGVTLTAGTVSGDPDGDGEIIAYQWKYQDYDGGYLYDIDGETSETYLVRDENEGKLLSVLVTYRDGQGNESTLLSDATSAIPSRDDGDGILSAITSSAGDDFEPGVTLTAGTVSGDPDGDGEIIAYQWKYQDYDGGYLYDIDGETSETYLVRDENEGKLLSVLVTYRDGQGNESTLLSDATSAIPSRDDGDGILSAITSSAGDDFEPGVTLTAGTVSGDPDGDGEIIAYQWKYQDYDGGYLYDIDGETSETYLVRDENEGKLLSVLVTYRDGQGNESTLLSDATSAIPSRDDGDGILSAITSSAGDDFEPGVTLTAGTVSGDPDGDGEIIAYQWKYQDYDGGYLYDIDGETSETYLVRDENEGKLLSVLVTYRDGQGNESTLLSDATSAIPSRDDGDGILSAITSSAGDDFEPGVTLTAGTVSGDPDGDGEIIAYQWKYQDYDGGYLYDIDGETSETYLVRDENEGKLLSVLVTYRDGQGNESTLLSDQTPAVTPLNDEGSGDGSSGQSRVLNDISLGTIKGSSSNGGQIFRYSGLISNDNSFDGLRFSLDSDSYTYFDLTDLTSDLDLYLYRDNPTGEENDLLYTSDTIGLESESFFKYLSVGDYAAFVVPYDAYPDGGYTYTLEIDTQTFLENAVIPNDPLFSNQWHLFNTGQGTGIDNSDIFAPEAWRYQSTSPDIVVAVIDGGVDLAHEDLVNNLWVNTAEIPDNLKDDDDNGLTDDYHGWNFANNSPLTIGDNHGTHVAGTIGAEGNNRTGVTGVSWDVNLMSLDVFGESLAANDNAILQAIYYAVDNGANVINMSLGHDYNLTTSEYIQQYPEVHNAYFEALSYAVDNGTSVVIATGNEKRDFDDNWISAPAYFSELIPGVISVASVANNGQKAYYSNYGSKVTIAAPGGSFMSGGEFNDRDAIFSTSPIEPQLVDPGYYQIDPMYGYMSGTSMAAPVVSGAIALLLQKYPFLTPAQVEEAIVESASTSRDLVGVSRNGGYLNLADLLNYYENDSPSTDIPSNTAPTDLSFTASSFDENIAAGTAIGSLTSTDANAGDTFTYTFVSGTGDTDNAAFTIDGAELKINASPDYETKSSYSIRVRTTDAGGLFHEDVLILGVNNLTETPAGGSGGSTSGGGGGGGGSIATGGSGGSSSAPTSPPPSSANTTSTTTESTEPTPTTTSPSPVTPTPSQESSVLGIQPQATVTTVQLSTPLKLGNLEVTQVVVGTTAPDLITGSDQGEALAGGQGKDRMTGGGGSDGFVFETVGEFGKQNADVITDFSSEEGDKLIVSSEAFDGVSQIKFKSVTGKREVKRMGRSNKNFIYDDKKGMLYYDANGKKDGFGPGGEFAQLLSAPEIGKTDLIIA